MPKPKLVVLDGHTLNPGDLSWSALEAIAECTVHDRTPAELMNERLAGAAIALTNKVPLRGAALDSSPDLRFIGVLATGYDIVDVAAARSRGIVVSNIPTYGTNSVAQLVFAHLLELCHRVQHHSDAVHDGAWSRNPDWSFWNTPLVELAGKSMGIVGFGRIGQQTGRIAHAFGMKVLATDRQKPSAALDFPFEWMDLEALLAAADVVSLHCPLTPDTREMINRARLEMMKRSAILINTSRGPLIAEQDLADALRDGTIAAAGIDVLAKEPPPPDHALMTAPNCLITPHLAWATREARSRLLDTAVANVEAFLQGRPQNVVS